MCCYEYMHDNQTNQSCLARQRDSIAASSKLLQVFQCRCNFRCRPWTPPPCTARQWCRFRWPRWRARLAGPTNTKAVPLQLLQVPIYCPLLLPNAGTCSHWANTRDTGRRAAVNLRLKAATHPTCIRHGPQATLAFPLVLCSCLLVPWHFDRRRQHQRLVGRASLAPCQYSCPEGSQARSLKELSRHVLTPSSQFCSAGLLPWRPLNALSVSDVVAFVSAKMLRQWETIR